MSSLNYSSRVIADVEYKHVTVEPVLGLYRILFHLEFDRRKWDDNYVSCLTSLRVAVKLNDTVLGTAFPTAEDFLSPVSPKNTNPTPVQRSFALDIDLRALERIEDDRREQGVTFELDVFGTATVHLLFAGGSSERMHSPFPPPLSVEPLLFEPYLTKADISMPKESAPEAASSLSNPFPIHYPIEIVHSLSPHKRY